MVKVKVHKDILYWIAPSLLNCSLQRSNAGHPREGPGNEVLYINLPNLSILASSQDHKKFAIWIRENQ
jgi:hypothetical protein